MQKIPIYWLRLPFTGSLSFLATYNIDIVRKWHECLRDYGFSEPKEGFEESDPSTWLFATADYENDYTISKAMLDAMNYDCKRIRRRLPRGRTEDIKIKIDKMINLKDEFIVKNRLLVLSKESSNWKYSTIEYQKKIIDIAREYRYMDEDELVEYLQTPRSPAQQSWGSGNLGDFFRDVWVSVQNRSLCGRLKCDTPQACSDRLERESEFLKDFHVYLT